METAKLDNLFQKIFSKREERNELTDGRESGVESIFPPKMSKDQVEKKKH